MQEMVTISIVTYNSRYIFNVLDQLKAELGTDSIYDIQCANNAGVDSGLVLWSNNVSNPIRADYYFKTPNDISKIL